MQPHALRGRYEYRTRDGRAVGRERIAIEPGAYGESVLTSTTQMEGGIRRDVVYAIDETYHPRECYVRVVNGERFGGSAWFWFGADALGCEVLDPHGRRATRRVEVPAPVLRFGTHSLVTDGWFAAGRDLIFGPLQLPVISVSEDGALPPDLEWAEVRIERMGCDATTTAAGTFRTLRCGLTFASYPPIELWLREHDGLCVRQAWSLLDTEYELVELVDEGG